MTGIGIPGNAGLLVVGLALLALLLFAYAIRSGRWTVWVLGYIAAIATLCGAFFFGHEEHVDRQGSGAVLSLVDVPGQRSPVTGVVEHVRLGDGRRAPASSREASSQGGSIMIGIDGVRRNAVRESG